MKIRSFNRVVVDKSRLTRNFHLLQKLTGDVPILAMVKGDGYGHGIIVAAHAFAEGGCHNFGVAELCEGIALRQAKILGEILIATCFADGDASVFWKYKLTPVISNYIQAKWLNDEGRRQKSPLSVHLKINSGMGRLGLLPEEVIDFVDLLRDLPYVKISGAMGHFPESDIPDRTSTKENFKIFEGCTKFLKKKFNAIIHIANSSAILHYPETHCDMVRAGIVLYGYPLEPVEGIVRKIIPAMSVVSRIIEIQEYPVGASVSYGGSRCTYDEKKIATIPIGYEDGLSRKCSNQRAVLIRGKRVPLRGRIYMNMCMVDVSQIADVQVGDEVVLLGKQGEEAIFADEIARELDTVNEEILCRFGHMNRFFE